jgi:hypothetical protein
VAALTKLGSYQIIDGIEVSARDGREHVYLHVHCGEKTVQMRQEYITKVSKLWLNVSMVTRLTFSCELVIVSSKVGKTYLS